MRSPSPLAARSPAPIHRRPKTARWPNRTLPAFPARPTPALATLAAARASASRGLSSLLAWALHLIPGSPLPRCPFTRCHPISLRHRRYPFCSAIRAHSHTVVPPEQGTQGLVPVAPNSRRSLTGFLSFRPDDSPDVRSGKRIWVPHVSGLHVGLRFSVRGQPRR